MTLCRQYIKNFFSEKPNVTKETRKKTIKINFILTKKKKTKSVTAIILNQLYSFGYIKYIG